MVSLRGMNGQLLVWLGLTLVGDDCGLSVGKTDSESEEKLECKLWVNPWQANELERWLTFA